MPFWKDVLRSKDLLKHAIISSQHALGYSLTVQVSNWWIVPRGVGFLDGIIECPGMQIRGGTKEMPKLFCVPILVKDNTDVVGTATTAGAVGLQDNMPLQDAHQVVGSSSFTPLSSKHSCPLSGLHSICQGSGFLLALEPISLHPSQSYVEGIACCKTGKSLDAQLQCHYNLALVLLARD